MLYIIITCYNSEKTIAKTLDSIINQTMLDEYKIIIVNDCSTDATKDIVKTYKKSYPKNIKIVNNYKNKGAGWSRRIGLRYVNKSKDNWVTFIDSDDYVGETYLYNLWLYTQYSFIDIISGSITFVNEKTNEYKSIDIKPRYINENLIDDLFSDKIYFLNNKLVRASLFKKVKYSKSRFIEDVPTLIKLCLNARAIQVVNNKEYYYRSREDSLTHTADDIKYNIYDTLSKIECYKYFVNNFKGEVPKHFNLKAIVTNIALLKVNNININEIYKQYPKEIDTIFKFLKSKGY